MDRLLLVTLVVVALCTLGRVDSSAYDKIVTHSRIRARKEGPNVCALQQVLGTQKKYFSTCRNWYKGSICGKKAVVVYECCPGYMKLEGMRGCPAVAPIDHVYGTLGLVKATSTQQYSDMSKLREEIEGRGSFTMFAPSNDAWDLVDPSVRAALVSNVNIELYNALHFHMVNHRVLTKDMKDGKMVTSMYSDQKLYFNHYPNGVVTVNCARIIHANQVATNGVVHVIDRVISAVSKTIKEVLDLEDSLVTFSTAATAAGLMDKLDQPGQYTLFAPTDEAFDKLGPGYFERIMDDKNVIAALVNYHILNSVQCAEAIMAGAAYETAEGSTVEIGCDGDTLTVNGIKMVLKKDIVTSNGVIHLIDQVLIPDSAQEVTELIGKSQSTFGDMMTEMGFVAAMGPKAEYTLLAPLNSAFTTEVMSIDESLLRLILENHILKTKVTLSELYNGQLLETVSGKMLRVFVYRTAVCIENACMVRGSKEGSNGALHLLSTLIRTTDKSIYEILVADGRFKIFLTLMEVAGLQDMLMQEGSYTIFAPTDDAFDGLSKEDLDLLKSDVTALRTILLYHFSNGVFINGGLEGRVTNLVKTVMGYNLQVKSENNSILVNNVDVTESDMLGTNGAIHVVKNILYPGDLPVGRQDLLVLLQKLIKYIQIKFVSGFAYEEIPLHFFKKTITTTRYVEVPESKTTVIKFTEDRPTFTNFTVIKTESTVRQVNVETEPSITTVRRVIQKEPSIIKETSVFEGQPGFQKVTRVIGTEFDAEGSRITGPDFTKITTIHGDPSLIKEESERITSIIKEGGRFAAAKKSPAGIRRRTRLVRRHHKPRE
ncbi:periostin-like [Cololabis saira]|uniref:periostin-like n=1 Tax=Cololabis saira TaxID=129043 RepID=UPI002AD5A9E3|nr:periostin-like [Cololabis saira]